MFQKVSGISHWCTTVTQLFYDEIKNYCLKQPNKKKNPRNEKILNTKPNNTKNSNPADDLT